MQIPQGASFEHVKKTYRNLAKKYHPDRFPDDPGAEEYFKTVTEGYNLLSDPGKKRRYDQILSNAYSLQTRQHNRYPKGDNRNPEAIRNKLNQIRLHKQQELILQFINREKELKHSVRYTLISLGILSGYLFAFNRWFVNEASMDYLYIIVGLLMFIITSYVLVNHLFIHLRALKFMGKKTIMDYEKGALLIFLVCFLGGPLSIAGLNQVKKQYHLKHYGVYVPAVQIQTTRDRVIFTYVANNQLIYKSTTSFTPNEVADLQTSQNAVVKVSKYNPKIAKLEFMKQSPL